MRILRHFVVVAASTASMLINTISNKIAWQFDKLVIRMFIAEKICMSCGTLDDAINDKHMLCNECEIACNDENMIMNHKFCKPPQHKPKEIDGPMYR